MNLVEEANTERRRRKKKTRINKTKGKIVTARYAYPSALSVVKFLSSALPGETEEENKKRKTLWPYTIRKSPFFSSESGIIQYV